MKESNCRNKLLCPLCNTPIDIWIVARSSLFLTDIKCKRCEVKFKYEYPWWYSVLFQSLGVVSGVVSGMPAIIVAMYLGKSNDFYITLIGALAASLSVVGILLAAIGIGGAKISMKYFKIVRKNT